MAIEIFHIKIILIKWLKLKIKMLFNNGYNKEMNLCNNCQKTFSTKSSLTAHQNLVARNYLTKNVDFVEKYFRLYKIFINTRISVKVKKYKKLKKKILNMHRHWKIKILSSRKKKMILKKKNLNIFKLSRTKKTILMKKKPSMSGR